MKLTKYFFASGALLLLLAFGFQAQAALSYNVSADPGGNPAGIFSGWDQPYWSSGDIVLPGGTTIGPTPTADPLEVDLLLSHDVTLNGSGHYGWLLNYADPGIPTGADLGTLAFNLLENGTVVASVSLWAGNNNFGVPPGPGFTVWQFGTGNYDLTPNVTFNKIQIFVSNQNQLPLTDLEISVDAVPEPSTIVAGGLALLALGVTTLRRKRAA